MFTRLLAIVLLCQFTFAQQTVTGTVYAEKMPLEGAAVIIKGTNQGTITDASGMFSLSFSKIKNPKVMISYLGHKTFMQKIKQTEKDLGDIHLSLNDELEEVVVSGTLKPVSYTHLTLPTN